MEAPAGDFVFGRRADAGQRLRRSTDIPDAPPDHSDDRDWPAFRANNAHNGSNASVVAPAASILWTIPSVTHFFLPPDAFKTSDPVQAPTPSVIVGDHIFAGNADGSVRCLQLGDGREIWRYYTSAKLFASPTWYQGRLYVGSGDGFVYCLDATSGQEIWRFQAAPVERRILWESQLISTWPVTGSVLVEDGVVYVWACLLNRDGAHVYALDAKTGAIKWQNNDSGAQNPKALWSSGANTIGQGTIAAGRLWIRNLSYALRDGTFGMINMPNIDIGARYTGTLEPDVLLTGGCRQYSDQHETKDRLAPPMHAQIVKPDGSFINTRNVSAYSADPGDFQGNNGIGVTAMPVWDGRQFAGTFLSPGKENMDTVKPVVLGVWDKSALMAYLRPTPDGTKPGAASRPAHLWKVEKSWWYGVAMVSNVVVGIYGHDSGVAKDPAVQQLRLRFKKVWGKPDLILCDSWGVAAYDRDTGKPLWDVPLASEPLQDGVSIARDGSVVVQLLDGSVVCVGTKTN